MEKLVREELERWDSDASLRDTETRPTSANSRMSGNSSKKKSPKSATSRGSPRGGETSVRIKPVSLFDFHPSFIEPKSYINIQCSSKTTLPLFCAIGQVCTGIAWKCLTGMLSNKTSLGRSLYR